MAAWGEQLLVDVDYHAPYLSGMVVFDSFYDVQHGSPSFAVSTDDSSRIGVAGDTLLGAHHSTDTVTRQSLKDGSDLGDITTDYEGWNQGVDATTKGDIVLNTSWGTSGEIHVFDSSGNLLRDFALGSYSRGVHCFEP